MSSQLPVRTDRSYSALEALNGAGPLAGRVPVPASDGGVEQGVKRYLAALFRYKWMILLIIAAGAGVGFVVASKQQLLYESRARVWIGSGLAGGQAGTPIRQGQLLDAMGWQQLLTSTTVLDSVVRRERLYLKPARVADSLAFATFRVRNRVEAGTYSIQMDASRRTFVLSDASGSVVQRAAVGDSLGARLGFLWVPDPMALPGTRPIEFTVRRPADVVLGLSQQLSAVVPARNDNFMNIRLRGTDREEIARVLTAIVTRFEEVALELKRARLTHTAEMLNTQLKQAEGELAEAENELEQFKVATITLPTEQGVPVNPGLTTTDQPAISNYWRLTTEKDQLGRDRENIARALETRGAPENMMMALNLINSVRQYAPLDQALKDALATDTKIRTLKVAYTDLHPQVQAEQQRLDSLVQHVIPAYAHEVVRLLAASESETDRYIGYAAKELRQIPERSIREGKLERRRAIADQLYRHLEKEHQEAKLAEVTTVPDMQVLDWPSAPYMPIRDQRVRLLLLCMGGSLGLALLGAILRDRFDPRLRYPNEVTGGMGLFILGAVPALRRGKLGATDMALAVESFRGIQLSILHAHGAEAPLLLTLTSPGASDGKSFVTSNLAIAFADMGHRTLIIDGDVRRGSIHQLMGASHKPGLTDHLAGHATKDQVVQNTRYMLLDMIACGSRGEAGPKLLGSAAMARLMDELRNDYDVILVDTPPLGACVDPMILSTLTRNLVLVLRSGTTDRTMAESKLQILDRLPVRVLGAILNDVPARGPYRYYSYMSGYEVLDDVREGQEVTSLPAGEGLSS
jgi:succinoglycan biosynthesis transport protein ExoP